VESRKLIGEGFDGGEPGFEAGNHMLSSNRAYIIIIIISSEYICQLF
jgi:hypothetical protein